MVESFEKITEQLKSDMGEGFVANDFWHQKDAQSLYGFNTQPKACALFNEVTRTLDKTMQGAEFPGLGEYYVVHLENDLLVVIAIAGEYQHGMLVDLSKTTMGILMSVALPNLLSEFKKAIS